MNLVKIAHATMIEQGFNPEIPGSANAELGQIDQNKVIGTSKARDLRQLLWSSIDNLTSIRLNTPNAKATAAYGCLSESQTSTPL